MCHHDHWDGLEVVITLFIYIVVKTGTFTITMLHILIPLNIS